MTTPLQSLCLALLLAGCPKTAPTPPAPPTAEAEPAGHAPATATVVLDGAEVPADWDDGDTLNEAAAR